MDFKDGDVEYAFNRNEILDENENKKQTVIYNSLNLPMPMEIEKIQNIYRYSYK